MLDACAERERGEAHPDEGENEEIIIGGQRHNGG